MRIAITGHRPNKLGNDYDLVSPLINRIRILLNEVILNYQPTEIISGMALGIDTLWAQLAIENSIPLVAAIPFKGQESMWPQKSQKVYNYLLSKAKEIVIVNEGGYSPSKMQIRNEWMVDNCNLLIAVWDETSGGTANCVNYAKSVKQEIIYINPKKLIL
jgi:uncharacterized phage-like protein YoqJ